MKHYDPLKGPQPEQWLSLEEEERMLLVEDYHRRARIQTPNSILHASMHTIVENQVVMEETAVVKETLERLMSEGLDRHDAIHAIGAVLFEHMQSLLTAGAGEFDQEKYFADLRTLTPETWRERYG